MAVFDPRQSLIRGLTGRRIARRNSAKRAAAHGFSVTAIAGAPDLEPVLTGSSRKSAPDPAYGPRPMRGEDRPDPQRTARRNHTVLADGDAAVTKGEDAFDIPHLSHLLGRIDD
jgi:hypothetical protein